MRWNRICDFKINKQLKGTLTFKHGIIFTFNHIFYFFFSFSPPQKLTLIKIGWKVINRKKNGTPHPSLFRSLQFLFCLSSSVKFCLVNHSKYFSESLHCHLIREHCQNWAKLQVNCGFTSPSTKNLTLEIVPGEKILFKLEVLFYDKKITRIYNWINIILGKLH